MSTENIGDSSYGATNPIPSVSNQNYDSIEYFFM